MAMLCGVAQVNGNGVAAEAVLNVANLGRDDAISFLPRDRLPAIVRPLHRFLNAVWVFVNFF